MKKRIGMQYFAPAAIYWLVSSVVLGLFLIFLSDIFKMYVLGFIELGVLALSAVLALMGMILLDLLKKPSRYGYLFQAISYLFMAAGGVIFYFFRFSEPSSWTNLFFLIGSIGSLLGSIYTVRAVFGFLSLKAGDIFAQQYQDALQTNEPIEEKQTKIDPDQVIEVDAVDVDGKED